MVEVQGRIVDRFEIRKVDIEDDLVATNVVSVYCLREDFHEEMFCDVGSRSSQRNSQRMKQRIRPVNSTSSTGFLGQSRSRRRSSHSK